jgi:hypothetical protein
MENGVVDFVNGQADLSDLARPPRSERWKAIEFAEKGDRNIDTGKVFYLYAPTPTLADKKLRATGYKGYVYFDNAGAWDSETNTILNDPDPTIVIEGTVVPKAKK